MKPQIFGQFSENFENGREFLNISFSPSSLSIQQRWRNNGLSADFVADYMITFFPCQNEGEQEKQRQSELKHAVSYIANELLENAMKFNCPLAKHSIEFGIYLLDQKEAQIILYVTNSINSQQVKNFQVYIQKLLTSNPEEFYIEQMEINAENPDNGRSKLGFLTMLNDYGAKLGWKFEQLESAIFLVTTMVQLTV